MYMWLVNFYFNGIGYVIYMCYIGKQVEVMNGRLFCNFICLVFWKIN